MIGVSRIALYQLYVSTVAARNELPAEVYKSIDTFIQGVGDAKGAAADCGVALPPLPKQGGKS